MGNTEPRTGALGDGGDGVAVGHVVACGLREVVDQEVHL